MSVLFTRNILTTEFFPAEKASHFRKPNWRFLFSTFYKKICLKKMFKFAN
jgi:hypothetical protein